MKYPENHLQKEWIQQQITDESVDWSKSFGEYLQSDKNRTKPLTTSQIRKFFGELKRIQADPDRNKEDIPLLKAKLAYAVGRDKKNDRGRSFNKTKIGEFYEELEKGIDYIRKDENRNGDLIRFVKLIESIVAYHKFYGGE